MTPNTSDSDSWQHTGEQGTNQLPSTSDSDPAFAKHYLMIPNTASCEIQVDQSEGPISPPPARAYGFGAGGGRSLASTTDWKPTRA
jgi:hypothetical protein